MKHIILGICLITFPAFSFTIDNMTFKDTVSAFNKTLQLNGVGIRKATWFKVKVYYGALYVEKKTSNVDELLQQDSQIEMVFVRDVTKKKLIKGFEEGLKSNKLQNIEYKNLILKAFENFKEIKEGQKITFLLSKNSVNIKYPGSDSNLTSKIDLRQLLKLWIHNPPNKELKNGLLGKN